MIPDVPRPLDLAAGKVVAVHVNYASRARERGRVPTEPSYFFKPASSLAGDGDRIVRPQGCELLCYEGEIALVIGSAARRVSVAEAERCIGWVAAANDLGVYDLRWADRGSNVLAKGQDGFTPIGPQLAPAAELDLGDLTLRTFVNGEVVQEGHTSELLFGFAALIADLSRFMTLEPGDVLLTGTPAGSRPLEPGDVVEVEVEGVGRIGNEVVEDEHPLESLGAMPKVDAAVRAQALGSDAPPAIDAGTVDRLRRVSTATLTTQLQKRGIRSPFLTGLRPLRPDLRLVGVARTLRYVATREDLVAARAGRPNAQRRAVESVGQGEVLVIEARDVVDAGTMGDILALRALRRGAAGIVTDGAVRDSPAIAGLELPTYCRGAHASVLQTHHYPLDLDVPVTCAGVLVLPGDVIVGDAEGVVVVPAQLADEVARDAVEQELVEQWALERIDAGEGTAGTYPLTDERRADYEAWRAARADTEEDA
jgi:2-keto-4-pentenoate hydratase/2-oxohepta-3-ene-1,7-dioic acid hydratase in catechol pathway/regulator of RNase E activity RraA